MGVRSGTRDSGSTSAAASNVPSRPLPTSPWTANRSSTQPTQNTHQPNVSQPELNDQTTTTIPSSSPFRVALRPRHQSYSLTAPTPQQQHQSTNMPPSGRPQGNLMPYTQRRTNQHRHHRHGRLTSALLGFVDTIDNLAISHHQPTTAPGAMQVQQPTTPAVPTLHRSDRGLGGIGRASERQQNGSSEDAGEDALNMIETRKYHLM